MTHLVIALIIAGWLLCSVIAYAGAFAYYQGTYPDESRAGMDRFACGVAILGGPVAFLVSFFYTGGYKYGLRFW